MTDTAFERPPISPIQLAGALLGGMLVGGAHRRRGVTAALARVVGAGLALAALTPGASWRVVRAGAARRRVRLRTTLVIDKPVRDVFAFCHDFENFPRVVHTLESVTDYRDGRSRWQVLSPSGEVLAWDVVVTKYVPNVVIAWRSEPGSVVDCRGLIRFAPLSQNATRLDVDVQYDPCHTGFADAVRALIEVRRQDQVRAELARATSYLHSLPPAPGATDAPEDDASSSLSA